VTLSGFPSPIDPRVIGTTREISGFLFNLDMNSGYHLGIGEACASINKFNIQAAGRLDTRDREKWIPQ
jgi:hypothetical protein